jgi:hypothetical protein
VPAEVFVGAGEVERGSRVRVVVPVVVEELDASTVLAGPAASVRVMADRPSAALQYPA